MPINQLSAVTPSLTGLNETGSVSPSRGASGFQELVSRSVDEVNGQINQASQMSQEFLVQNKHDLHEVMIALDQADLSFRYMVQVRNKVLEAYNDVMRMQV